MKGLACQYTIIRFLPYAETGEFANVGVVLACPATGFLDARLLPTRNTRRITGFFDQLDKSIYRDALRYLNDELKRIREFVADGVGTGGATFVQNVFGGSPSRGKPCCALAIPVSCWPTIRRSRWSSCSPAL